MFEYVASMRTTAILLLSLLALFALAGCEAPMYERVYQPRNLVEYPPATLCVIRGGFTPERDQQFKDGLEHGAVVVGISAYETTLQDVPGVYDFAKAHGANVIYTGLRLTRTSSGTMSIAIPGAPQTTTSTAVAFAAANDAYGRPAGSAVAVGAAQTTAPGPASYINAPYTIEIYYQQLIFVRDPNLPGAEPKP